MTGPSIPQEDGPDVGFSDSLGIDGGTLREWLVELGITGTGPLSPRDRERVGLLVRLVREEGYTLAGALMRLPSREWVSSASLASPGSSKGGNREDPVGRNQARASLLVLREGLRALSKKVAPSPS